MNAVVAEARITLDTRLLGKDVIVLPFEVTNDFREAILRSAHCHFPTPKLHVPCFVVDLVAETWRINNGQGNASAFFIEF